MIIFTNGSWAVTSQTITRKGEEMEIPCKLCQYAPPVEKNGKTWFPKLGKNAFFQVTVQHLKGGDPLKVKYNIVNGFRVAYPSRWRKANWFDAKPTIEEKVEPTNWMRADAASSFLVKQFNPEVASFVIGLIMDTVAEVQEAASKKEAA